MASNGVSRSNGVLTPTPALLAVSSGPSGTSATGINASGQIVGYYTDASRQSHGFLLDKGRYTMLRLRQTFITATGTNASGQIVGYYRDGSTNHGFLFDNGSYTTRAFDDAGGRHGFLATPVP